MCVCVNEHAGCIRVYVRASREACVHAITVFSVSEHVHLLVSACMCARVCALVLEQCVCVCVCVCVRVYVYMRPVCVFITKPPPPQVHTNTCTFPDFYVVGSSTIFPNRRMN